MGRWREAPEGHVRPQAPPHTPPRERGRHVVRPVVPTPPRGRGGEITFGILRRFGDHGGGETPVPFPNTEVKPSSADGTAGVTRRESRSLPSTYKVPSPARVAGL